MPRPPWPKHYCGSFQPTGGGIGGSGYSGWQAVRALREMGFEITEDISQKIFGDKQSQSRPRRDPNASTAAQPVKGPPISVLGRVDNIVQESRRLKAVSALQPLQRKVLGLTAKQYWQVTLVQNGQSPAPTFTCLIDAAICSSECEVGRMASMTIEARIAGGFAEWEATSASAF